MRFASRTFKRRFTFKNKAKTRMRRQRRQRTRRIHRLRIVKGGGTNPFSQAIPEQEQIAKTTESFGPMNQQ